MEARILAVADVVEAIASRLGLTRVGLGIDVAPAQIESNKGTLHEADVLDASRYEDGDLLMEARFSEPNET